MLNRPDTIHLMEELYDSAIPELLHINAQALREATTMDELHHPNAPEYLDLVLVPEFMKNKNGMVEDSEKQREIAVEVLAGLHEAWNGSEALEHKVNPHLTEQYWEFTSGFTSWTVVEAHYDLPQDRRASVSAYLLRDKRPVAYQKMLTAKINEQEELEDQASRLEAQQQNTPEEKTEKPSRRQRAAKAIGKWARDQVGKPPRHNRFE